MGVVDRAEVDADAGGSRRACQDVDEVVAVSRKVTWPPGRRQSGDDTCVCSEEAAAPPRVSPIVARVGGGLVTTGDSRSRFPDRRR